MKAPKIPVLTDVIDELSDSSNLSASKVKLAFFSTFFIAETRRERLLEFGIDVHRKISRDAPFLVTYTLPVPYDDAHGIDIPIDKYVCVSLREEDPFASRTEVINSLNSLIEYARRQKKIKEAKALLESSLTPAQLEALRALDANDLKKAFA